MERKTQRVVRSPSLKRRSRVIPLNQRVQLERVIGLTGSSNATLDCDINTGTIAYPAGCVVVLLNGKKQSHIINSCKKTITAVKFSKDGKNIVTGECGHQPAVRVWDVEEKIQVAEFYGHKFGINCVAFSPNNKYIVSIGSQHDMMAAVWNWKTGNKVATNKISSKVSAVAFSEDGSMFVTVGNRHVKFWYLESSKSKILNETVPLSGRSGILGELKNNFFTDVVCGKNKSVFCITQSGYLCNFNEKRLLEKWAELRTTCANCVTAAGDYIFIGCANGVVRVFSAQNLHYIANLPHPHYLGVDVASALNPSQMVSQKTDAKYPDTIGIVYDDWNNKVTCIYNDHSMYIWDVHDVKKIGKSRSFLFHSSFIYSIETSPPIMEGQKQILPPGSFITCSSDDTVRIWNLDPHMKDMNIYKRNIFSQELLKVIYTDPSLNYLRDVNYNPAGGTDKTDTNYDDKNGIRSLCISPDTKHLASGDRIGNIRIHDLETLQEIATIEAHDQEVLCLQYSNFKLGPKLLATSSRDRMLHVFDVEQNYKLLQTLDDHSSSITAVRFTQTEKQLKMLSCGADKSLLFRNAQMDPDLQFSLDQHLVGKTTIYDMVIDPTEKFAATACQDRNIRIYSIKTSKQRKNYKGTIGDDGVLMKLSLDPSGTYFATSCTVDKSITIIDYATGEIQASMIGHAEFITSIKFTNNLKHLISVSADGCIFVWRLPPEMTNMMQNRLQDLGNMYQEAEVATNNNNNETSKTSIPVPVESEFKTPSKILAELNEYNQKQQQQPTKQHSEQQKAKAPLDYRFSIGQLPKWAKNKFGNEKSKSPEHTSGQPKGKWAERSEQKTILAQIDGKKVEINTKIDRNIRKLPAGDDEEDDIPNIRRETMVMPHPENTPRKIPVIFDDESNQGEDDEDFFPSFHREDESHTTWDETAIQRSDSMDELQEGDVIYLPSEDSSSNNESAFTIFPGLGENRRRSLTNKSQDAESDLTDPVSLEDIENENDNDSFPSNPVTPSDEGYQKTQNREKFLQDTFENLAFSPIPKDRFERSLEDLEKQTGCQPDLRMSLSARFQSKNPRNMAVQQKSDNWYDHMLSELKAFKETFQIKRPKSFQRRKSEMARTVDETRKKIEAMAWKDDSPESEQVESALSSPCHDTKVTNSFLPKEEDIHKRSPAWDRDSETGSETSSSGRSTKSDKKSSRPSTLRLGRSESSKTLNETPKRELRSQSQSGAHRYMKKTESSKAKITKTPSSSNILNTPKSSELSDSSDTSKSKGPVAKRRSNFIKKKGFHASSPNLMDIDVESRGNKSNLLSSARLNLSSSTPDLLDIDTPPSRYSTGTPKRPPRSSSSSRGEGSVLRGSGRLSLPANPPKDSAKSKFSKNDKDLMPPPQNLPSKLKQEQAKNAKQDIFLKRATMAKRQNSNDLTLDQAKSILMGKSGILEDKKSKETTVTVDKVPVNHSNSSFPLHSSSPTYPEFSSNQDHLSDPKLVGIATEIETTVSELRRKSIIDQAFQKLTDLDASPYDIPERDSSPRQVKFNNSTDSHDNIPSNSSSHSKDNSAINSSKDSNTGLSEEDISLGVRERIAMLNAHSSPRSDGSSPRCSSPRITSSTKINLNSSTKHQTKVVSNSHSNPTNLSQPAGLNLSPPNSSGIGSSLDSDTAAKMFSSSEALSPPSCNDEISDKTESTTTTISEKSIDLVEILKKVQVLEKRVTFLEEEGEKKNERIGHLEAQIRQFIDN
ncbi:mitogen-activated protein kinase-binding protein 1-like isoform X4 [Mytilus californianus]|uniref:mitogen-activated protein kinase-binding protein 1-like isoform X4 n=1 Tax=Mytilus californianus TaxID=6549 RepID=UPI0022478AD2|nr:mitogen-activated protein kinase-binding protein 1-like isoform X4 [Mytilus californianus]